MLSSETGLASIMNRLSAALCGVALIVAFPAAAQDVDSAAIERDVTILSHDNMEGREAGTRGHERAAGYVAGRMAALGLRGGGEDGTYFQAVPMLRFDRAEQGNSLVIDGLEQFELGKDLTLTGTALAESGTVEAELVFVGYGLELPGRNVLDTVDLAGKIAVRAYGGPRTLSSDEAAHFRSTIGARVSARGAVGLLLVWTPLVEGVQTFERNLEYNRHASAMTWVKSDGQPYTTSPGIKFTGSLSAEAGRALLAGHEFDYDDLLAAEQTEQALVPAFPLGRTARVSWASTFARLDTPNVIGLLPGSDPALADQYLVLTAHLDHEGIEQTDEAGDDEIYNGAMDNAVGVSSMLEVARLLADHRPRRSVLFVALTAEEKGLLGSSYNAANPTVPAGQVVANVNLDMPIVTYPFTDVVALGAERSNLYPAVEAAVTGMGLTFSPDPAPEQGYFTRSDQYSYVRNGIPAVNLDLGWANGGEAAQKDFLANHYHQQSDQVELVDFAALSRFTAVNFAIARGIADMADRPAWNEGEFFGRIFPRTPGS
ncbi:MAG: M28 family peptidase [Alteraurantiacibacter sp.]